MYTVDDDLSEIDFKDMKYEEYWDEVEKLKDGDWERYEMLPRSRDSFNSNSETERAFSVQTDIHRNPKKNNMSQERFNSHMQIHFGVESKKTKASRQKCKDNVIKKLKHPQPHCHCCMAEISEVMINNCKDSYKLLRRKEEENSQEETELNDKQKRARKTWKEDGRS